jgi:glycosyltransferase involved in cell wall biosynthesis
MQCSTDALIADKLKRRPFISVAVPTFRRPETIRRAIESVLSQSYEDWDLIVSDDEGPGGGTWAIVSEYVRADPRVHLVENRRGRGQVENTNNALLTCDGQWIKLLHDDDWLPPDSLEKFAMAARKHPSAAFLTCCINVVFDDKIKLYAPSRKRKAISVFSSEQCLRDLYLARTTRAIGIVPSTLLVRRDLVEAGCLMRTYRSVTYGVDQLFFLDLAARGDLVLIREGLVFYDLTDHNTISSAASFEKVDQETNDLKNLNWSLIKNRRNLPPPDVVVRALRVARLRSRGRIQPLIATARDTSGLLRLSVLKLVIEAAFALARSEYRDFRYLKRGT